MGVLYARGENYAGGRRGTRQYAFDSTLQMGCFPGCSGFPRILVVTVALGSILATIILSKDVALVEGVLAMLLLIGLQFLIAWSSMRSKKVGALVKSEPTLLLSRGEFLEETIRQGRVMARRSARRPVPRGLRRFLRLTRVARMCTLHSAHILRASPSSFSSRRFSAELYLLYLTDPSCSPSQSAETYASVSGKPRHLMHLNLMHLVGRTALCLQGSTSPCVALHLCYIWPPLLATLSHFHDLFSTEGKMTRRISRRRFLQVSGMATAGAALAACAPAAAPEAASDAGSSASADASDSAAVPSSEVTEIEFMNWWGAHREALMDEAIANFHDSQDEVRVNNSVQPWDGRVERAATAIASSTPPALIMTQRIETYKFVNEGLIIPIDDYVAASGIDPDTIFYPGEINNQRWQGKLYSFPLPTGGGISGQYYWNKEVFRQNGLDPDAPLETWQDIEDASAAVVRGDDLGIEVNFMPMDSSANAFLEWLYCNDGLMVSEDGKTLIFNSPEGIETLEWMLNYTDTYNYGIEAAQEFYAGTSHTSADHPFYNENAATVFTGTWFFGHMKATDPEMWENTDMWGAALRPYNGNNPDAATHGVAGLSGSWGYVIPTSAPQDIQDAAYKWLEFFGTHEDGGCLFLFNQARPSPVIECNSNPAYFEANPAWDVVLQSLESDISVPVTPVQTQISDLMGTALEEAFFGLKDAETALNEAAEKGQAVLDDFWANLA